MVNYLNNKFEAFKKDNFNFVLIILLAFHIFIFTVFQILDQSNQTWDSAGHIGMSYNIAEQFKALFAGQINIVDFYKTSDYYPPFVQTLGAVSALMFGYNSELLLVLSLLFFIIAIIFVYIDVKILAQNSKIAFISAFIFSLFPQIFEQSRIFHLDLPLIALLLIAGYFYLKSVHFTKTIYSILFAVFFSLVQLTKWYGFIYLLIPLVMALIFNFAYVKQNIKKVVLNMSLMGLIVAVIALPWYIINYQKIAEYSSIFASAEIDDPTDLLSLNTLIYYPQRILSHQIFLLPFMLVLVSLIANAFKKQKKRFITILLSTLFPIIIFTLIGNKNLRYVLPLTPIFAYLIADLLFKEEYKDKLIVIGQKLLASVLFVYMLFAFFFTSFNQIKPQSNSLNLIGTIFSWPYNDVWYYEPTLYSYGNEYWQVKEIWKYIQEDSNNFEESFGVTPLLDKKNFSLATFELIRRENRFKKAFVPVPYFQFEPFKTNQEILDYYKKNDVRYVLVSDDPGPVGLRNYSVLKQMNTFMLSRKNIYYEKIKSFDMPDSSQVHVFKKLPDGKTLTYQINTVCKSDAGIDTGIETIKLVPNHTYVFFTGHYAFDKYIGNFEEGLLYIVQIENIPHQSNFDVYNLPHTGTGMCIYDDLDIDLSEAIKRPLIEPNNCGVDCQKVVHVKWRVGEDQITQEIYTRSETQQIKAPNTKEDVVGIED